ncbi:MAG: tRNA (adenosine(37)-N6)-threonylcarbamoyltransferase complex dimerization subunit type 1 TsaB [Thiobacillaceae bacterium]
MNLLALDTSTEFCSCAVWRSGDILWRGELAGQRHSDILLLMIDGLLSDAGLALKQLDGIAFGAGPGSFTGIRIACSVVQGLALGADLPVVPVCTLEALAELSGSERVVAALDARLDEIYVAYYRRDGDVWQAVFAPVLCSISDAPALGESGWAGVGSGFSILDGALVHHFGLNLASVNGALHPEATAIARLGANALAMGKGRDAAEAQPIYLRNKVALTIEERSERKRA